MKRFILLAALLIAGLFSSQASAQGPAPSPRGEFNPSPYGWHPRFQEFVWNHGGDRCGRPNLFGRIFGKTRGGYVPGADGGTLVFPNHPYARSPRDFFMLDQ